MRQRDKAIRQPQTLDGCAAGKSDTTTAHTNARRCCAHYRPSLTGALACLN